LQLQVDFQNEQYLRGSSRRGTALGAIDHGYRVIIAEDAVCSSSDQGHDSLLALFAQRFSLQLEVTDTQTILGAWAVV
jgi:nicotinamidase-related amidase